MQSGQAWRVGVVGVLISRSCKWHKGIYIRQECNFGGPRGQAHVQDPTSYTDTDFALLARRIRDLDKSITSFY